MNPYEDVDAVEGPRTASGGGVLTASPLPVAAALDGELFDNFDDKLDFDSDSSDDGL
jgi:hypothetical protein